MMSGEWRKQIGPAIHHKGHSIIVRAMQPDVMVYVDDAALPNFYLSAEHARQAAIKYIDQIEKERKQ